MKLLRFESHKIMFFLPLMKRGLNLKKYCILTGLNTCRARFSWRTDFWRHINNTRQKNNENGVSRVFYEQMLHTGRSPVLRFCAHGNTDSSNLTSRYRERACLQFDYQSYGNMRTESTPPVRQNTMKNELFVFASKSDDPKPGDSMTQNREKEATLDKC